MKFNLFILTVLSMCCLNTKLSAEISTQFIGNNLKVSTDQIGTTGLRGCDVNKAKSVAAYRFELQQNGDGPNNVCRARGFKGWTPIASRESDKNEIVFKNLKPGSYRVVVHTGQAIGCQIENSNNTVPNRSIVYNYETSNLIRNWNDAAPSKGSNTNQIIADNQMDLFPNPTQEELNIFFKNCPLKNNVTLLVLDMIGKEIERKEILAFDKRDLVQKINVSQYSSGAYLVRLVDDTGQSFEGKFVVQKE